MSMKRFAKLNDLELNWAKLARVTTDGGPTWWSLRKE